MSIQNIHFYGEFAIKSLNYHQMCNFSGLLNMGSFVNCKKKTLKFLKMKFFSLNYCNKTISYMLLPKPFNLP